MAYVLAEEASQDGSIVFKLAQAKTYQVLANYLRDNFHNVHCNYVGSKCDKQPFKGG